MPQALGWDSELGGHEAADGAAIEGHERAAGDAPKTPGAPALRECSLSV